MRKDAIRSLSAKWMPPAPTRDSKLPHDSALVTLLGELTGNKPGTVAFGTEAAQMSELGAEAVVLGPGDIREAHRTGEFVPIAELEACVEVLRQAIERLCI